MRLFALIFTATLAALVAAPTQARHYHHRASAVAASSPANCWFLGPCPDAATRTPGTRTHGASSLAGGASQRWVRATESGVVAHPAGCPRRAFCGCGAAVRLLGAPIRALWLAAAWYRFPRAAPAPGTAGVRPHHVVALIEHRGGSRWLVYDANSGGHATRIHEVDISRYTIVSPRA